MQSKREKGRHNLLNCKKGNEKSSIYTVFIIHISYGDIVRLKFKNIF